MRPRSHACHQREELDVGATLSVDMQRAGCLGCRISVTAITRQQSVFITAIMRLRSIVVSLVWFPLSILRR